MLNNVIGLLGGGTPAETNSYESIATVTVGAGGAASVDFTSIPSTYKHLQIRGIARAASGGVNAIYVRLNSDSSSSYAWHLLYGTGSSAAAANGTSTSTPLISYQANPTNDAAGVFGASVTDILDYSNTNKNKTLRNLSGHDGNGSGEIGLWSALWQNTAAVTSVSLVSNGANFAQYSSFALYGIKG